MSDMTDDQQGTITLDAPIEFQNRKYETLQLREPTIGEVIRGDGQMRNGSSLESMHSRECVIISAVTGWPLPAAHRLPISVHNRAWSYLEAFLRTGLQTSAALQLS